MDNKIREQHESFGAVQISRITVGGGERLFGSHLKHSTVIRMSIYRNEKIWHLHRHWFHPTGIPLIEIDMSPAQFAEAITNQNVGEGIPCTIKYVDGKEMAPCPDENVRELIEKDFEADMDELTGDIEIAIHGIRTALEKKGVTKADLKEALVKLYQIEQTLHSNMPFIQKSFNEAIDKTVHAAKVEVEAFVQKVMMDLGKEALANSNRTDILELGGGQIVPGFEPEFDGVNRIETVGDSHKHVTSYPVVPGVMCSVCHEPQYETPHGRVCVNGHGGADSISVREWGE